MKRIICFVLACLSLCPALSGCAPAASGRKVCLDFLRLISSGDYSGAYALVDEAVKYDGQEDREAEGLISEEQFISKYMGIFEALGITSVLYENIDITEGDVFTTASFTAEYSSSLAGDIRDEHRMVALRSAAGWRVEWSPALIFPEMEWGDKVRSARLGAKRGEIMAGGELLATTEGKISVYAMPARITDENRDYFFAKAGALLGMGREALEKKLKKAYDGVAVLRQYCAGDFPEYLESQLLEIEGVGIDYGNFGSVRSYPKGSMLAHTLGYVGIISGGEDAVKKRLEELNRGRTPEDGLYNTDSYVGRSGLEARYETDLRGRDGRRIYICTPDGANRRTLYTKPARDGCDLQLTVNPKLQARLEFVLNSLLYGDTTAGAVVIMNPVTGAVDAMASWPSYDLNSFARGISGAEYKRLLNMPNKPLYNRLTQGLYPPGSVLKAFTAAAALQSGTLDENYVFTGEIKDDYWLPTEYGAWTGSKIKRAQVKYGRLSPLNMRSAIVHSDNIYFANAALMMGWDTYRDYMSSIGFGEAMPFDLNVAKSQLYNADSELSLMLLAESGYGQGQILTTPLQMASMFCAFANGGNIARPYIVKSLCETEGITYRTLSETGPRLWKAGVLDRRSLDIILPYLEDAVNPRLNGTGQSLRVTSVQVAAKTGTAEIGSDKSREIAWFAGFRVGVEPERARLVLIMLEIPVKDEFVSLKFDIAREMLKMSAP